jgi:predicted enzyme related to lactoylglutathione lyase
MTPTTAPTRPRIDLGLTVLDTPDPKGLADFYAKLLGWDVVQADDDWVTIRGASKAGLAFQLAPDHVPPTWPAGPIPQQFHLDLDVSDLDAASSYAESLSARQLPDAGSPGNFVVFLDPAGHPFCLCSAEEMDSSTT